MRGDWEADILTSVTFTQRKSHPSLGNWRGFSCTHHNYCLCKQLRTQQAITLGGNSHFCELCFGSDPSQDLRSNVNHPQCFKAPGKICKSAFPPKLLPWGGGGGRGAPLGRPLSRHMDPGSGLLGTVPQDDENGSLCQGLAFRDICEVMSS